MSAPILKREYSLSRIESIKWQLNTAINRPLQVLNDTQLIVLTYIHVYGMDTKKKLVDHRIVTNPNSGANYISMLVKYGYATREDGKLGINPNLKIVEGDFIELNVIKSDEKNLDVEHPYYKREVIPEVS
jgi:hypothetical protein